jgi:putative transposase
MPKDTHSILPADAELVLPERVTVALAELADAAREGLLALAVGTGLGVLGSLLDADVERLVGPKGRHNPQRAAVRHGTQPGRVTLGGRRVRVDRPRVRSADGAAELALPTWQAFASTELLDQLALERMLAKLSTRRYHHGLEPVGSRAEQASSGTSRSAVSRRFVAATEHALAELLAQDLSGLDLVALLVDGIRVAEHTCVVALGITLDGTKVPLALAEGATENATVVGDLLAGLRDRGLDTSRPLLVVLDGAKAPAPRGHRRIRSPSHSALPAAQAAECDRPAPGCRRRHGGQADAGRLPQPRPAARPGQPGGAGAGAGPLPPRRRRVHAGRAG